MKPELLIFDVNETLLDLSPLKECINQLLGSSEAFDHWFPKLIQFAMVETLTGSYSDFSEIGAATLKMTARSFSKSISEEEVKSTLSVITQLKPHPDVLESLECLKQQGFKLVALTNGGKETLEKQMNSSGLNIYFDAAYSVESVKKFKPHPETYQHVLREENCLPKNAMLIAAHAWDIMGAKKIGMQTAFIKRLGKVWYPNKIEPSLTCSDFEELSKALVKLF